MWSGSYDVLFTDIVGSTETAASLGDARWRAVLDAHDRAVREQLHRIGGREVKHTGDGFLISFDGPARGIRCATAISEAAKSIGIEVRAGLHTGECEVRGDDLGGLAVHIAARVNALAAPGEVLVTSTVKDLVIGSGMEFTERGEHTLKGVPESWAFLRGRLNGLRTCWMIGMHPGSTCRYRTDMGSSRTIPDRRECVDAR